MSEERLRAIEERCALLEGRLERMFRPGTISAVDLSDTSKPRARIVIGDDDDGQPVLGPWVPYSSTAGERNQHNPPSIGQQFLQIAPDGDHEQAVLLQLGHSSAVPSPSTDPGTYVDGVRDLDVRFKQGKHQVKAGEKTAHLITDKGQRLQVEDLAKLVIKVGEQTFKLSMDALEPTKDLEDF